MSVLYEAAEVHEYLIGRTREVFNPFYGVNADSYGDALGQVHTRIKVSSLDLLFKTDYGLSEIKRTAASSIWHATIGLGPGGVATEALDQLLFSFCGEALVTDCFERVADETLNPRGMKTSWANHWVEAEQVYHGVVTLQDDPQKHTLEAMPLLGSGGDPLGIRLIWTYMPRLAPSGSHMADSHVFPVKDATLTNIALWVNDIAPRLERQLFVYEALRKWESDPIWVPSTASYGNNPWFLSWSKVK